MLKITMTSQQFRGHLVFNYNEAGRLCLLEIEAELNDKQKTIITNDLPWDTKEAKLFMDKYHKATFLVQEQELTFLMFWNRYNDKVRSSKKKTEAIWNKLSRTEQTRAYLFIPTYFKNKGTAEKKYATTYLSDELWNN